MKNRTLWVAVAAFAVWWFFLRTTPGPGPAVPPAASIPPAAEPKPMTTDNALALPPGTLVDMTGAPYQPSIVNVG